MNETTNNETGWCHDCDDNQKVMPGHFACSPPPEGYGDCSYENGEWVSYPLEPVE